MYFDTTPVADTAGGYTYVHCKQRYDQFAAAMTAQGNWTLVDTVDSTVSTNTLRRYVWKSAAPGNGLANDFYLIFECTFVTATGVWASTSVDGAVKVSMAEQYNTGTKTASKMATVQSSIAVTIGADLSHPGTWVLTTGARPTNPNIPLYMAPNLGANLTSEKHLIVCTASTIVAFCGPAGTAAAGEFYAGVFDSVMDSTDDLMPIFLGGNGVTNASGTGSILQAGATTRHPKMTPSTSYTGVFGFSFFAVHATNSSTNMSVGAYNWATTTPTGGAIGDPTNLGWPLFLGGPQASRCCISSSGSAQSGSTRGGLRGFLRHIYAAQTPAHSTGDMFKVDGKNCVGSGRSSANAVSTLLDTTA